MSVRKPNSVTIQNDLTVKNDLIVEGKIIKEQFDYDIAVIGSGISAITTLKHLSNTTDLKVALFTNAKMTSFNDTFRHNIVYPENLEQTAENKPLIDELKNLRKKGSYGVTSSFNAGYSALNLGAESFKNKSEEIYYRRFTNLNTPENSSGIPPISVTVSILLKIHLVY